MNGGRNAVRARLRGAVSRALRELGAGRGIGVSARPVLESLEERILFGGGSTILKGDPQVANDCPPPANAASDAPGATDGAGHNVQTNDNDMFTLKDLPQPPEPQPPSIVDRVRRAQMISEVAPGSRTLFPVSAFDGMPIIQSADLSSTPFGMNWAIDRSWVGSDDSGPVGNGWAIAEAPNITVTEPTYSLSGDSNTLALPGDYLTVSFGADASYDFAIPPYNVRTFNTFDSFTPTDGQPLQLVKTTDGGVTVLKMTDAAGNSTEFYDVPRDSHSRPIPFTYGTPSLYGQFYKSVTANGTTVTASYNGSDQLTGELITNPASSASEQYVFSYTPTGGTGTVTNSMVTGAGGTVPQLVSEIDLQEKASGADSWHTQRSVTYTYYDGDGTDNAGNSVNTADGRLGDLEMATVHDSVGNVINQDYYRYYKLTGEQYDQQQQQINGQFYSNPSPTNVMSTTGGGTPLYQGWGDDGVQGHTIAANPYADDYVFSGLKTVVNGQI